jgi:glycosyltransferase involved in cell wall biosynthesis
LSAGNITVDVTTVDMVSLEVAERYDLLIFHRPSMGKKLEEIVNRAKQRGCIVIADYDDLIFCPDYAVQCPDFLNQKKLLNTAKASFKKNYDALFLFDHFTVSTNPLAVEIEKIRPFSDVTVIHNYLSDTWLQHNNQLCSKKSDVKRITYLSGTNSHNHDFSFIQDLLSRFLSDNSDGVLRIVGPLDLEMKNYNKHQLELLSYVPYPLLPSLIHDSWVTIAPLANNIFNNCKSGLKYFESAVFGVPVIASPIDDMQRLNSEALHLADSPDQWIDALNLLSDSPYYDQCAVSGINHVKENCVMSHQIYKEAFSKYL